LVSSIHKHLTGGSAVHAIEVFEDLGKFSSKEIRQRIEPLIAVLENTLRLAEVRELLASEAGSVLDPDEALAKLQAGTIRTLFVAEGHELHLRECANCRAVNRAGGALCGDCSGQREDVTMLDALTRLAAAHDTELRFVTGEVGEMLAKAGGLAGRLRQQEKTAVG
jgi:peptide subunit release factor 1 (eRF1)